MIVSSFSEIPSHITSVPPDYLIPEQRAKIAPGPVDFTVLGEDQMAVAEEFMDYIDDKLEMPTADGSKQVSMYVIEGYAGTGKTFLVSRLVNWLLYTRNMKVALSAPTHKALQVSEGMSEIASPKLYYKTIHSLLGLQQVYDDYTGKIKFVPNSIEKYSIDTYDVLLLDEASMLNKELYDLMQPAIKNGLKVVFIGDPLQLPPVGEIDAMPFVPRNQKRSLIKVGRLVEIRRQALGNPILSLATAIRLSYNLPDLDYALKSDYSEKGNIILLDKKNNDLVYRICDTYFNNDYFTKYPDFMKVLAWENKVVSAINKKIRTIIYKQDKLPAVMPGEKMVTDGPVMDHKTKVIYLNNNQEFEVISSEVKETGAMPFHIDNELIVQQSFLYYETLIEYRTFSGLKRHTLRIIHEEDEELYKRCVSALEKAVLKIPFFDRRRHWPSFYKLKNLFDQVKYNYALTVHKSQGSTFENAMMIDWNILSNPRIEERNRMRYVSTTRARTNLFIINNY